MRKYVITAMTEIIFGKHKYILHKPGIHYIPNKGYATSTQHNTIINNFHKKGDKVIVDKHLSLMDKLLLKLNVYYLFSHI